MKKTLKKVVFGMLIAPIAACDIYGGYITITRGYRGAIEMAHAHAGLWQYQSWWLLYGIIAVVTICIMFRKEILEAIRGFN